MLKEKNAILKTQVSLMPETKYIYQITLYNEELHILQKPQLLKITTSELVGMSSLTIKTTYFSIESSNINIFPTFYFAKI